MSDDRVTVKDHYQVMGNGKVAHFRKIGALPWELITDDAPVVIFNQQICWVEGTSWATPHECTALVRWVPVTSPPSE